MKVVYQICCGVDVHNSILQIKEWLIENQCRDICMESTGKYRVPVFTLLEDDKLLMQP